MASSRVPESSLEQAEQRVRIGEGFVARQTAVIRSLVEEGHQREAWVASRVLGTLRDDLAAAHDDLLIEQWIQDLDS